MRQLGARGKNRNVETGRAIDSDPKNTLDQQIVNIRKFCKQNPDEQVMAGVVQLYQKLPSNADGQ
jgi:hypothetical protein